MYGGEGGRRKKRERGKGVVTIEIRIVSHPAATGFGYLASRGRLRLPLPWCRVGGEHVCGADQRSPRLNSSRSARRPMARPGTWTSGETAASMQRSGQCCDEITAEDSNRRVLSWNVQVDPLIDRYIKTALCPIRCEPSDSRCITRPRPRRGSPRWDGNWIVCVHRQSPNRSRAVGG